MKKFLTLLFLIIGMILSYYTYAALGIQIFYSVQGKTYTFIEYKNLKQDIKLKALNGTIDGNVEFQQFIELLNQNCPQTFTNVKTIEDIINVCL